MRVELRSVGHRFEPAPWLFRNLNVVFEPGHTYAITGPSGSGKSSLLGLVAGWNRPAEGAIEKDGITKTSWVFQNSHGSARRSAIDHVVSPLLVSGLSRRDAEREAETILERFSLDQVGNRVFRELSGGEAQRLMLARAVAADPALLLVDEPTAQLDSATSHSVNVALAELSAEGRIVLIATHDPGTMESCSFQVDISSTSRGGFGNY